MSGAPLGGLDPAGWACNEDGEIKNGEPQCKEGQDEHDDDDDDDDEDDEEEEEEDDEDEDRSSAS